MVTVNIGCDIVDDFLRQSIHDYKGADALVERERKTLAWCRDVDVEKIVW
jgi:hypothetical protein